jgi:ribosomal protein S18 acetylase RimI-like enzyme
MMTRYPIRDARPEDAEAISAVHEASREVLYRGRLPDEIVDVLSPEERLQRWNEWLSDPDVATVVGEEDGRIVGFSTVRAAVDPDLDASTVAEMPTLYVHPAYWRRGWGTVLCGEIERRSAQQGFALLTLWVMEMNERARAFYVASGFEEDGAEKLAEAPDPIALKALRYRKELV